MTPGRYDPPVIYRGCDWPTVTLFWKDVSGNAIDLTGFTPFAQLSNGTSLNPRVTDPVNGITTISIDKTVTGNLKTGKFWYDWIWWQHPDLPGEKFPPSLFGEVVIQDPKTHNFNFIE